MHGHWRRGVRKRRCPQCRERHWVHLHEVCPGAKRVCRACGTEFLLDIIGAPQALLGPVESERVMDAPASPEQRRGETSELDRLCERRRRHASPFYATIPVIAYMLTGIACLALALVGVYLAINVFEISLYP